MAKDHFDITFQSRISTHMRTRDVFSQIKQFSCQFYPSGTASNNEKRSSLRSLFIMLWTSYIGAGCVFETLAHGSSKASCVITRLEPERFRCAWHSFIIDLAPDGNHEMIVLQIQLRRLAFSIFVQQIIQTNLYLLIIQIYANRLAFDVFLYHPIRRPYRLGHAPILNRSRSRRSQHRREHKMVRWRHNNDSQFVTIGNFH
mmetsp:Transcript_40428/g.86084  ORF Transcript_40428/g.86084 Transcript_40428/m.86084 type:complete len:201 (-) Transcript_40428:485-1087(-)